MCVCVCLCVLVHVRVDVTRVCGFDGCGLQKEQVEDMERAQRKSDSALAAVRHEMATQSEMLHSIRSQLELERSQTMTDRMQTQTSHEAERAEVVGQLQEAERQVSSLRAELEQRLGAQAELVRKLGVQESLNTSLGAQLADAQAAADTLRTDADLASIREHKLRKERVEDQVRACCFCVHRRLGCVSACAGE
jgi:hypothetical protein